MSSNSASMNTKTSSFGNNSLFSMVMIGIAVVIIIFFIYSTYIGYSNYQKYSPYLINGITHFDNLDVFIGSALISTVKIMSIN